MIITDSQSLYSIGIVSELLDVHPETIRTWERSGLMLPPKRRSGKRTFSGNDLKRLQFIQKLAHEGLSLRAISYHLRLYPCWHTDECGRQAIYSAENGYTKPCWREAGAYCTVPSSENLCENCIGDDGIAILDQDPQIISKSQQDAIKIGGLKI